jgi:ubiquinone/menaquinone biosynthesis C-methylase UbiE
VDLADVTQLPFADDTFSGYLSVGVIEHFFDGYQPVLQEAKRVLKNKGHLFLIFPAISWLRRQKIIQSQYPLLSATDLVAQKKCFYQFILPADKVVQDLEGLGFTILEKHQYDGLKGWKDEVSFAKNLWQLLYQSVNPLCLPLKYGSELLLRFFAAHCVFLIAKKGKI